MTKTVIAGALGECVHVAGISNFLRLAEDAGWRTVFLGPAASIETFIKAIRRESTDMTQNNDLLVGVSYRLTPENGERLLSQFAEEAAEWNESGVRFAFGGTPPVAECAKALGFFEKIFDGSESPEQVLAYLKGHVVQNPTEADYPQRVTDRIAWRSPYPILRHHFGLPTMEATIEGIQKISKAEALDLISLGTDQDAQENFFHPERQDVRRKGAGGVPVRTPEDFRALYEASRCGNFPMLRAYSGTDDFVRYAEVLTETIKNAWCAIPLFWFNQMDGRGPWDLEGSIREHQRVIAWYGERHIPVELNEPHHWGMRDAPIVQNVQGMLDEIKQSTYANLFDRLGVPKKDFPDFSNIDTVLSALLEAIGTDEHRLDLVLSYSDITEKQLFKAAEKDIETKQRLLEIGRKQLKRDLHGFYATGEWHHHRCFARYPVFLTDGALYLAEHGGAGATTAYWLMDLIASYQGAKQMKRIENPQLWKIECFGGGGKRSCVVSCGNNPNESIIEQEIEWTNFLLNEYELYASLEPFDEGGRLALIISLIAER